MLVLTPAIRAYALRQRILDDPSVSPRKVHKTPTPLLGGLGFFMTFVLMTAFFLLFTKQFDQGHILTHEVVGVWISLFILIIGGYLDDRFDLSAGFQFLFPLLAVTNAILFGIGIDFFTNPFGGIITIPFPFSSLFTFFWLLGMIYTLKFLDGLDGLATGVAGIGAIVIFLLSYLQGASQSSESILALILFGSCLGFLRYNFHPARIFLGEGGSTVLGFLLGVLAIISGGKIATTLLVLGFPILDVIWVIVRRVFFEKKSMFIGDKKHFHHRLLAIGLSHRQTVFTIYFLSFSFGITTLFLQSAYKIVALVVLTLTMILLGAFTVIIFKKRKSSV